MLVLDKPSGLLTISSPKKEARTLTSIVNEDAQERKLSYRLHPCHRLDRGTSGLIIYAKGKSTQAKVMRLFAGKKVKKTYLAFVHGNVSGRGQVTIPIEGENALTRYQALAGGKDFTVIELTPATGRTNQLRLHMKAIGHPIVGEDKFVFRRHYALKAKRLCLHAARLSFPHPVTGREIRLEAPQPLYFQAFLSAYNIK